ncbi:NYN domain-containing protein [Campylobacter sp. JMF_02 ED1]|uniref:NYN domain-containing protein n=1 Tax=unclassified Campylobacter TaxID=2593542 RepID=UPI0022E9E354|nr:MULTISPECIES: NYN domain-containing protein [unclassified Campylobacter]MDA3049144.1 NYN domain-containing protein [Campylobacter sp. JMF_15 NE4]MDA3051431.1 NYN domain-containing protein [Campylobacter sp. JMF_02 ED1]
MQNLQDIKLAVLIDGDNASASKVKELFEEIAKFGIANVKRIYGDWSSQNLQSWKDKLYDFAIIPVQQFNYTPGKNATDMQLIIDAMDLLNEAPLDGFCIVSSDSDFTPLVSRLRQSGKTVYGFGKKQTPNALIKACNKFIYIENLGLSDTNSNLENKTSAQTQTSTSTQPATQHPKLPQNTWQELDDKTKTLLYTAIKATSDEDTGWAYVSDIRNYISAIKSDFDPRDYGYAKISNMLKTLNNLQFKTDNLNRMYCKKIPLGKLYSILRALPDSYKDENGWIKIDDRLDQLINASWNYKQYDLSFYEALQKLYNVEMKDNKIKLTV